MKALKAEAVCLAAYESVEDATAGLPRPNGGPATASGCVPRPGWLSPARFGDRHAPQTVKSGA